MMPAGLLIIAALSNFLPGIFAEFGGTVKAWEYVFTGVELTALWLLAGSVCELLAHHVPKFNGWGLPMLSVCAYGAFEASQRPVCRLMFPMDAPPAIKHPDGLCAAAGIQTYELSPLLIALCAVILARTLPRLTGAQTYQA